MNADVNFCAGCGAKRSSQCSPDAATNRSPFCCLCGHEHVNEDVNFCAGCGTKRASQCSTEEAATAIVSTASESTATASESTATAIATTAIVSTVRRGRPSNKLQRLRCGWCVRDNAFVSPDGKEFQSRQQAMQYSNKKDVPILEPARQDGWQVFVDESETHSTWIAPDGQKLNSFVSAKSYARSSSLPIFGKDGITKSIASFFCKSKPATTGNKTIDLTKTPRTKNKSLISPPKIQPEPLMSPPTKAPRKFTIPKQSNEAATMQKLFRKAARLRHDRKSTKAAETERQYNTKYTAPRKISDNMAAKVSYICIIIVLRLNYIHNN